MTDEIKRPAPCPHSSAVGGGVYTNWDPYGTRRRLGLPTAPFEFICWTCWYANGYNEYDAAIREETDTLARKDHCGFLEAWVGHCLNPPDCEKHSTQKCWYCGAKAVANCSEASTFVCGVPYCKDHPHSHERGQ